MRNICIFDGTLEEYPGKLDTEFALKLNEGVYMNMKEKLEHNISILEKELNKAKGLKEKIDIIQIKKYISMQELQIYIGRSRAWINDQILNKNFPSGSKKSGKGNLFLRTSIDLWIEETYHKS